MVSNITSLTNHGLRDWLIQRVTAIVMALYSLMLFAYFLKHPTLNYAQWQQFFSCEVVRIASFLCLLSLALHAWIGMWTISTDYLKPLWVRLSFQVTVFLALIAYLAWGIAILWRV